MPANSVRGQVEIELGGIPRVLIVNYETIKHVEDMSGGKNFFKLINDLSVTTLSTLLFCGLVHGDPHLSLKKVLAAMNEKPLEYWAECVANAIKSWRGIEDEKAVGDSDPLQNQTATGA